MKRSDIEQIVRNAYRYGDEEVINLLSKNHRTAGIADDFRNFMSGAGLRGTPVGAQFTSSADFTAFKRSGVGATENIAATDAIISFWRNALNASKIDEIAIPAVKEEPVAGTGSSTTPPVMAKVDYMYNFRPRGYITETDWNDIYNSLNPADYNRRFAFVVPSGQTGLLSLRPYNSLTYADQIESGRSGIEFKSGTTPFTIGDVIIKIESGGVGPDGYIELLKDHLATSPPMDNDDNHADLIEQVGIAMSGASTGTIPGRPTGDRFFSSMLRQTTIGQNRAQGLASTWNYIVGLPQLIQARQNRTPGSALDYKQKMILKSKGDQLQKLLDKTYQYTDTTLQRKTVRLAEINKLSKDNFATVMPLATADLRLVGDCVAFIQQELDKDNSFIRKFIKDTQPGKDLFKGRPNIKL